MTAGVSKQVGRVRWPTIADIDGKSESITHSLTHSLTDWLTDSQGELLEDAIASKKKQHQFWKDKTFSLRLIDFQIMCTEYVPSHQLDGLA